MFTLTSHDITRADSNCEVKVIHGQVSLEVFRLRASLHCFDDEELLTEFQVHADAHPITQRHGLFVRGRELPQHILLIIQHCELADVLAVRSVLQSQTFRCVVVLRWKYGGHDASARSRLELRVEVK